MRIFVEFLSPFTDDIYADVHWAKREKDDAVTATLAAVRKAGLAPVSGKVDLVLRSRLGKGVSPRDTSNNRLNAKLLEYALVKSGILAEGTESCFRRVIHEPPEIDRQAVTGTWVEIIELA
ncbi:hypothetical protein [Halomonas caseinilytica]|uniref:hypothetical protein n=1 Tax=Halomonas caseinilytica TaxID=438744 RepID=UPI0007E549F0|nr:hypothetical protein [Halomonas caseinilytica]SEN67973.1 hypothetical protein SAMN04487952_12412 [Halomonas caseinilytica]